MKKSIRLFSLTLALSVFAFAIPFARVLVAPVVTITSPSYMSLTDDVYTSGIIEETLRQDINISIPIVPTNITVKVGDNVNRGEKLADVDVQATSRAIFDLASAVSLIPEEYGEVLKSLNLSDNLVNSAIPTAITAPISGTITSISLVNGAVLTPNSSACTISDVSSLRLRLSVQEEYANQISLGDTVVFKSTATGREKFTATVKTIFPSATQEINGTSKETVLALYAEPTGSTTGLKAGYSLTGVIKKQGVQDVLTLPYQAIGQDDQNREFVYLLEKGRAVKHFIETGAEFQESTAVTSGISSDCRVILNKDAIKKNNQQVRM